MIHLQKAFAIATCSRIATTGTRIRPTPKSLSITSNFTVSVWLPNMLSVKLLVRLTSLPIGESTGCKKLNGGIERYGMPDFISPIKILNNKIHLVPDRNLPKNFNHILVTNRFPIAMNFSFDDSYKNTFFLPKRNILF